MRTLLLATVAILCLFAKSGRGRAPAPFPRTARPAKPPTLLGNWRFVEWQGGGYQHQSDEGQQWVISPTTITIRYTNGHLDRYAYWLDNGSSPRTIDLVPLDGNLHSDRYFGIYDLTANTLRLARGNEHRPTTLDVVEQGRQRTILERVAEERRTR